MSTRSAAAAARPLPSAAPRRRPVLTPLPGGARGTRPRLQAVRAPLQSPSRVPFLALCMSILLVALLAALVLNTTMARGSYEASELRWQLGQMTQDAQSLATQVREAERALPRTARSLGMVPAEEPIMVRISDRTVVGAQEAEGSS